MKCYNKPYCKHEKILVKQVNSKTHYQGSGVASQTTWTRISVRQGEFIEHVPQDWSTRAMVQTQNLSHDPELRFYKSFKSQIHKHLCQVIPPIRMQGQGISIGTHLCWTLILLPLVGVFKGGRGLPLPDNIHVVTYLTEQDLSKIHVLTCQLGCQLHTSMSLSAKQVSVPRKGLGT